MMRLRHKCFICILLLLIPTMTARATDPGDPPDNEGRFYFTDDDCIIYIWQLMAWQDLQTVCSFWLYNEGWPTASEVRALCGAALSMAWYQTAPISPDGGAPASGYYLLLDKLAHTTCKTRHSLPPVKFNYYISGSNLEIWAADPIPDQEIISISGSQGPHLFECPGDHCSLVIIPTGSRGNEITIQATSTQSAAPTQSQILYIRYQPPADPELVDHEHGSAAQQIWGSFQDQQPVDWLGSQAQASSEGFLYLAGRLISTGLVDASSCPSHGLVDNGYASICGLELAWLHVLEYQNRIDGQINQAAAEQGIPGQLLKRLIAIESQFWPSHHINWGAAGETGLGQLTHNGADTLLMWDPELYEVICRPLFGPECDFIYSRLDSWQQAVLQNKIMTDPRLEILARALVANAAQAGAIIRDLTGERPGALMDHQDLWRAALVNYNAGSGCLRAGLRDMIQAGYYPSWGSLATSLEAVCPGSTAYVERIATMPSEYQPGSWLPD